MAQELGDTKLLAKLSAGDVIPAETKYHRNCLTRLCNTYHYHDIKKSVENSALEDIQGTFFYLI